MKVIDLLLYSLNSLKERKVRTALTIIGILIGPAAVVGITGLTSGYGKNITSQLLELGTNTILVEPNSGRTLSQNIIEEISSIKGVEGVWPFYALPAQINTPSGAENVEVFAINLQVGLEEAVPGLKLYEGTFPTPYDTYGAAIGWGIANPTNPQYPKYSLDKVLTLKVFYGGEALSKSFLIEGIIQKFGPSYIVNVDQSVFVSLQTGRELTGDAPYSGLLVIAQSSGDVNTIVKKIQGMYGNQLTVMSSQEALNIAFSITNTLNLLLVSAASVSFLVAFVGVTTTMYTSTLERTKEIGILKALGFKNSDIMRIFVYESMLMGLIGGALGIFAGIGAAYALTAIIPKVLTFGGGRSGFSLGQVYPVFNPITLILVLLIAVFVGALAGVFPAYRASKIEPIKVLRNE